MEHTEFYDLFERHYEHYHKPVRRSGVVDWASYVRETNEDFKREERLKSEREKLRKMILEEKGRSGLEGSKSVDRLVRAIQAEGFTVD